MIKLIRCNFCNCIITIKELGLKDKDIGVLCKSCFTWMNEQFIPICRGEKTCQ